jgi:hypothetical protein
MIQGSDLKKSNAMVASTVTVFLLVSWKLQIHTKVMREVEYSEPTVFS